MIHLTSNAILVFNGELAILKLALFQNSVLNSEHMSHVMRKSDYALCVHTV